MNKRVNQRNEMKLKKLGAHIRSIRQEKEITQEELAFRASIAFSSVNRLENGRLNVSISTLFEIADSLEVDVKTLLDF